MHLSSPPYVFRGFLWYFVTWFIFYGEELLAPRPTPKLEDHPLSAVRDCLFKIFAATLADGFVVFFFDIRQLRNQTLPKIFLHDVHSSCRALRIYRLCYTTSLSIFSLQDVHDQITQSYLQYFTLFKKKSFKWFYAAFVMERILENFVVFYAFFVLLLVFILQNTLKIVTGVTETCRC
jgi:hypothetical protein